MLEVRTDFNLTTPFSRCSLCNTELIQAHLLQCIWFSKRSLRGFSGWQRWGPVFRISSRGRRIRTTWTQLKAERGPGSSRTGALCYITLEATVTLKSYVAWCPGPPAVLSSSSVGASAGALWKGKDHHWVYRQLQVPTSGSRRRYNYALLNPFYFISEWGYYLAPSNL